MGYSYTKPKISVIAFLISQSLYSLPTFAAGFQINEISPGLQGDATAGAAAANNDVSAMFINPATLSTLQENQGYLGASEIFPNVKMSDATATHTVNVPGIPPSSITANVIGKNYQNSISPSAFVPDGYIGWKINDKWFGGVAFTGPFGLKTAYSQDSALRFASLYSSVKTVDINPAFAYLVNDKWSVGAGLQFQYLKAKFSNFNGPYTGDATVDSLISSTFPTFLKGDDVSIGYNVGVLFKPDDVTRLGIGYRSTVSQSLQGYGDQYTSPGGVVPAPSQGFLFNGATAVYASVKTPAVLTMSAARDITTKWTVKASAQVNFWSSFKQLSINMPDAFATNSTIQSRWSNAWFGALGAEYHANAKVTVRGGVAYDQTPTNDTFRDSRIPDANRVWLNFGATYTVNKKLSIDGAYGHIFMQKQSINVIQASGSSATSTVPLEVNHVSANYRGSADIVALAARYRFN